MDRSAFHAGPTRIHGEDNMIAADLTDLKEVENPNE
jgi:hypothetical protein